MQPDRGYNNPGTTNWRGRFFTLAINFSPAPAGAATQNQVGITVSDTTLLTEANGTPFTALDSYSSGVSELDTPVMTVPPSSTQLTFRHTFNFEASGVNTNTGFDGGVLEIQIGASGVICGSIGFGF